MHYFALLFFSFSVLVISARSTDQNEHEENAQRQERGAFRSPNSNMDQNPDNSRPKRGVSRFGEAPIEREMSGNVSPAEAQQSGVAQPGAGVAQPMVGAVASPVAAAAPQVSQPLVGRKKRHALESNTDVERAPGQP